MEENQLAQTILYNGFSKAQQNHLYILVADSLAQQRTLYKWYMKLHACEERIGSRVCESCAACRQINHNNYVNSFVVQKPYDKKSVGVEAIADLQETFKTTAQFDTERFFCIEEADLLTLQAANSLLKFFEEPQGRTIGFLFTKNEQNLLPTIRSRGQVLRLLPERDEEQQAHIAQKLSDSEMKKGAIFLLQLGYEEKMILKQTPMLYEAVLAFLLKLAKGAPPIVAQADLEEVAQKTKTDDMVLQLLLHLTEIYLRDGVGFSDVPEVAQFVSNYGDMIYIAAYHALQTKRYHFGNSMLFTDFSLELSRAITNGMNTSQFLTI